MKQRFITLLAVLLTALHASAYDFEVDGIYYKILSWANKTVAVTDGDQPYSGVVVIPSTVTYSNFTLNVVSIGDGAFRDCTGLTSVTLPETIASIGNEAFSGCRGLQQIVSFNPVPPTVGADAFNDVPPIDCVVRVPAESLEAYSSASGWNYFWVFGEIVIEFDSFSEGCINYEVTSKEAMTVRVSRSAQASGDVVIPATVSHNGLPFAVTAIGNHSFHNCSGLTSVVIPVSVTSIGDCAFIYCSGLTSVVIGNSVKTIGSGAFSDCSGLTSVVIPESVTTIGYLAFSGCSGLTEITSLNPTPPSADASSFNNVPTTCVLKVPTESVELYKVVNGWKDFFNIVGIEVDAINDVKSDERVGGQAYNLHGQRVTNDYNGIVIRDGKKMINK